MIYFGGKTDEIDEIWLEGMIKRVESRMTSRFLSNLGAKILFTEIKKARERNNLEKEGQLNVLILSTLLEIQEVLQRDRLEHREMSELKIHIRDH